MIPGELLRQTGNATLAAAVYGSPFEAAISYPVGTPERDAIIQAYRHVQRLLCITGICLSVLLVAFSLVIRNPKLGDEQSLEYAEEMTSRSPETGRRERKDVWGWLKA